MFRSLIRGEADQSAIEMDVEEVEADRMKSVDEATEVTASGLIHLKVGWSDKTVEAVVEKAAVVCVGDTAAGKRCCCCCCCCFSQKDCFKKNCPISGFAPPRKSEKPIASQKLNRHLDPR